VANAPSQLYCSETDIEELLSVDGKVGCADDDADGSIYPSNPVTTGEQRFITRAINWGTEKVNWFCLTKYSAEVLASSNLVNQYAVIFAAYWLSCRRGNPPPGSFDSLYKEAIEDLKGVHSGDFQIPELGTRDAQWPVWSHVRVDCLYALRKNRVERPLSEQTPVPYPQNQDWASAFIVEP
jgi:hypothetical protein